MADQDEFKDPLRVFQFMVEAETSSGGRIVGAFSEFSGINMTLETVQARSGDDIFGVQEYIPALTRFEPVTLSKGVIGDNEFIEWLFQAAPRPNSQPKGGADLYRNLNVVAWDGLYERGVIWALHGETGVTWVLQNAMPIGYQLGGMDASRSEILVETMTFAITGMDRTIME